MKCLYYQWRISKALDSARAEANLPAKHMARCAECRRFYQRSVALGRSLSSAAATSRPPMFPVVAASKRSAWRVAAWAGAALAAAAGVAIVVLPRHPATAPVIPTTAMLPNDVLPSEHVQIDKMDPAPAQSSGVDALPPGLLASLEHPMQSLADLARQAINRQLVRGTDTIQTTRQALISNFPVIYSNENPEELP
jgi:hypothetical protein